jgi:hypothetical protein
VDDSARISAAQWTARNNPDCTPLLQPQGPLGNLPGGFYWEIGDVNGKHFGETLDGVNAPGPGPDDLMSIASASKWPFAAYVVQKYHSSSNFQSYIPYLDFTSGYSTFDNSKCSVIANQTVAECNSAGQNGINPADDDPNHPGQYLFHYEGGHMQQLAAAAAGPGGLGLGNDSATDLAQEVNGALGTNFTYVVAQPAGGITTTATEYASFLRRLMPGSAQPLLLASMLDADSQCIHSQTCATASPASDSNLIPENFHYGLGHWIEDDSATDAGIKAWSSAGAHGFYPWISNTSPAWYGILARSLQIGETDGTGAGYDSLKCGRAIRAAWITATQQPNGDPS